VLPISDIPVCLREFASQFRKLFKHPAQRQHFEEVLAGLIVSENRTVAGIQQKLLSNTEYDSLQHFMTDSPWSHDEMRKARLAVVSKLVSKEPAELNVIAIDSTLIHHTGADIHGVYWYWDYVNHRFCLGQKLVVSSFVTAKTVVPLGMELYHRGFLPEQKLYLEATKPAANASEEAWDEYNLLVKEYEKNCSEHKTQLVLAGDLVDECERNNIPVDVYVFDGGFLDIALMDRVDAYRQPWVCRVLNRTTVRNTGYDSVVSQLGLPLFIKPANLGSSVGVRKVKDRKEFREAVEHAFLFDHKILIEEFIDGREVECSVLGNDYPISSVPGEIVPQHEFYSYEAKYLDEKGAILKIPADLPQDIVTKLQKTAVDTFQTLCCEGMARVDMFLTKDNKIFVNEINTIPGFTKISMYPKLWEATGIPYKELVDRLIKLAMEKFQLDQQLQTSQDFE
jgi:hypothetical protein